MFKDREDIGICKKNSELLKIAPTFFDEGPRIENSDLWFERSEFFHVSMPKLREFSDLFPTFCFPRI